MIRDYIHERGTGPRTVGSRNIWTVSPRNTCAAIAAFTVGPMVAVAMFAAPARGALSHTFVSRVSEAPTGTPLIEPAAIAVDRASGDVLVADPGTGAVDVLSASGAFVGRVGEELEPSGIAVAEASGDVFVASGSVVDVFKPDGNGDYSLLSEWSGAATPTGEFGELRGVAVDNSKGPSAGDVYVVDGENNAVDVFRPQPPGAEETEEGTLVSTLSGTKLEEPGAVAVDASSGRVYVADSSKGQVDAYSPEGVFEAKLTGAGSPEGSFRGTEGEEGNVSALAAENGALYVAEAERHVVSEFNAAGEWAGWITGTPSGPFGEPNGVGVGPGGGLYVSDAFGALDIFGPDVVVPDARTSPASKVGKVSVVLQGIVNGDGKAAKYHFEWGTTEMYGASTPPVAAGSGEEKVTAEVTGLSPAASYHVRLVTENVNGANVGADQEFTTLPAVERLSTGPAQEIAPSAATVTGSLTPNGNDTSYLFEWGTSTGYGNDTAIVDGGAGKEPVSAKAQLTGLSPNTTYHYRLSATNSFGTTVGEDRSFTTPGPPRITGQPPSGLAHEAVTVNAKIDPDELETSYHFEYGETTAYGTEAPVGGAKLAAGETPIAVSAALGGLKIGTTYHYRVVASNSAGTTTGPDRTVQTVPPASIEGTSATDVSTTVANLQAQVNPLGLDTTIYFQYGTGPCKPNPALCTSIPAPPGHDIGAGEAPVPVDQQLVELNPGTTYHYRLLAINSLGTSEGPEGTLTTQPSEARFSLADNRAWELVTPPDKHGAPVEALTREGGLIQAAEDGGAITYVVGSALNEEAAGNRSPEWQQVLAKRESSGWRSEDIATPNTKAMGVTAGQPPEYQYFTPDLSQALVEPPHVNAKAEPPLAPGVQQATVYLRDDSTGAYLPIVTEENVAAGTVFGGGLAIAGATPDVSHVVLQSSVALLGSGSTAGLYEWSAGKLVQVSVLPDGAPASGTVELGYSHVHAGAVSADGSRVVWTVVEETSHLGHLYLRDSATGETLQLDAAQGISEPSGSGKARFQAANAEDSRIFFTDAQKLTPNSSAEPATGRPDLYMCEMVVDGGKLKCDLTDITAASSGEVANVQGFLFGTDELGAITYFVARGVLASNENGDGQTATTGQDNLYEAQSTPSGWVTTFVAALAGEDSPEWEGNATANTAYLTARVSPNGRYLAFMSAASLTGYDNRDATGGRPDEEVYLYDAARSVLTCVSCNPSGARPHGVLDTLNAGEGLGLVVDRRRVWGEAGHEHWLAGNIPGWTAESLSGATIQSRYLLNDGRLFFNSPDQLVPAAISGKESVFEYEPSGVGTCESATDGCVSLLSSGNSANESAFMEATPDGKNVFFVTAARLTSEDTDAEYDIYDARVCEAQSPCLTPASEDRPCARVETCRPAEPGELVAGSPSGSASFSGPGNVANGGAQPANTTHTAAKAPAPTRRELLAKALRECRRLKSHSSRAKCEASARRRYAARRSSHSSREHARKAGEATSRGRSAGSRPR